MKICFSCLIEKPLASFSRHSSTKDGLQGRCKACQAEYYAARKQSNPEAIRANRERSQANRSAKYWADPEAGRAKLRDAYRKNPEPVIARATAYYARNADDIRARRREYSVNNPEAVKAWSETYRANNLDAINERRRRIYHLTKEKNAPKRAILARKSRAKNAAKRAAYNQEYRRLYPERNRMHANRRRAIKLHRTKLHDPDFLALVEIEAFHLAELRESATGVKWEVDHTVPLQGKTVSGLHNERNLRVITRTENRSKSNRYWPDMP